MACSRCGVQSPRLRRTCVREPGERLRRLQLDLESENAFLGAAADGQHAVRGNLGGRLAVIARTS